MFPDILMHQSMRSELERIITDPPHALLLAGEEHLGKHLTARALAAELLGVEPAALDACGTYRELTAVKDMIPIETIRGLLPFFALVVPGHKKVRRVVLVPDAEAMTLAAENALLKMLEEPPADAVIILTSSHPDRLLPTIRSRCRLCRMQKPSEAETRQFLQDYDDASVRNALLVRGGTVGGAKRLLESETDEATADLQDVKAFLGLSLFEQLVAVDPYAKDREKAGQFVSLLVVIAEKGLLASRSPQWQKILQASLTADAALKKNANVKLTLTELVLSLR